MKKGFTMIELIFVIVILGVLASVAIPRLAATRDDAEVSKAATNLATAISDITAYYTAAGEFGAFKDMTSAVDENGRLNVKGGDGTDTKKTCLTLTLEGGNQGTTDTEKAKDAKIKFTISGSDPVCKTMQSLPGIKAMCGVETESNKDNVASGECTINVGGSGGIEY